MATAQETSSEASREMLYMGNKLYASVFLSACSQTVLLVARAVMA